MFFDELNLSDNILDALWDMHFEECTPVQEACIPHILEGRDIIGVAQTGTGKTAAYLLPVLSLLDEGNYPEDAINCVVMSPTRELAQQIDQAMQGFGYYLPTVSSVPVYGGNDGNRFDQEVKAMKAGADVLIATPGRLISHMQIGNLDLSRCSFFILDEADRMLDMGFSDDILTIAKMLPKTCQTIMFSATMPSKIEDLAKTLLNNPELVKLAVSKPAEKIQQSAYICYEPQKLEIIRHLFKTDALKRVIIFCGKKQKVKEIGRALVKMHINSGEMHSDLSQAERDDIMYRFKSGQLDVLVATDIVSRGIDIDDIAMVINYDVPHDAEDYVHRIGRTARAERDGIAITFVNEDDQHYFGRIEKFLEREVLKNAMPEGMIDGPEYKGLKSPRGGKSPHGWKKPNGKKKKKHSRKDKHGNNTKPEASKQEKSRPQNKEGKLAEVQQNAVQPENTAAEPAQKNRKQRPKKTKSKKEEPKVEAPKETVTKEAEQKKAEPKKVEPKNAKPKKVEPKKAEPKKAVSKKAKATGSEKATTEEKPKKPKKSSPRKPKAKPAKQPEE